MNKMRLNFGPNKKAKPSRTTSVSWQLEQLDADFLIKYICSHSSDK